MKKSSNSSLENDFQKRLASLNEKQLEAVNTIDGPVLVVAGPGSGKTELLSLRTAKILDLGHINPQNILLLTFTESGSVNMRERIVGMIGEAGYRVSIFTFHAFASDIMNRYSQYFWNGATFKTATDIEKYNILENIISKLKKDNPLSSTHTVIEYDNEKETRKNNYIYINDIIKCITALKKGNLSGNEFKTIIQKNQEEMSIINNQLNELFLNIKGQSKYEPLKNAYTEIYGILESLAENGNEAARFLSETLSLEIKITLETQKAKNLTAWKDEYFVKSVDEEKLILKDSKIEKYNKWLAFADIFNEYQKEMYNNSLYDFDDMIYKVAQELKENIALRNELEEKFQYIMIDEFQDTSEAQFAMLKYLTMNPVNEGSPNILAVGDDDQSVFKFQGAKLDNITKFVESFNNVKLITLDKNYRSTQNILNRAREIILYIDDRLENRYKGQINKNIEAANRKLTQENVGEIIEKDFENEFLEYDFVANTIKNLIEIKKINPKEISVIARDHNTLMDFSKFLIEKNINYSYEKKENCFDKKPIIEIINIVKFISSGLENNLKEDLLPEILSYKFWNIERLDIWRVAEIVRNGKFTNGEFGEKIYQKINWLEAMLMSENIKINNIAKFLIELIIDAKDMPLELLIDKIIGTKEWEIKDEYDDNFFENTKTQNTNDNNFFKNTEFQNTKDKNTKEEFIFVSPFREYYFGKNNFDHNRVEYLDFLFALRTFMGGLREYRQGSELYAKDLIDFVNTHIDNNIKLNVISPFATSENAIILQTAHKSKGLEYEYVFIVNSNHKTWTKKGMANKISMPIILPLMNEKDSLDDVIRLYFVAITRAKHTLYITNNKDKFSVLLKKNQNKNIEEEINKEIDNNASAQKSNDNISSQKSNDNISDSILNNLYIIEKKPILEDEKILLHRLLENYKMPVTHLINFINFKRIGPAKFIEQNLLRFPQAMSASSIYGSAIHEAMQNYYLYKNKYLEEPDIEKVFIYFQNAIERSSLSKIEKNKYLESGKEKLSFYINDIKNRGETHILFEKNKEIKVEIDFKNEGCIIGEAELSGKIDKIIFDKNNLKIIDLKTGKGFTNWQKAQNDNDKIKLHFYKYQLAYYFLLIKNSKTYNMQNISSLHLEFVEEDNHNIDILSIDTNDKDFTETVKRVESLIKAVYKKIINLNFPDISKYLIDKDSKGTIIYKDLDKVKLQDIIAFENDLLNHENDIENNKTAF